MNALQSYIRHLIVTGLVLGIEKFRLPSEGADEAANVIALAVVGTLTWLVAKYGPQLSKRLGRLVLLCGGLIWMTPSCAEFPLSFQAQTDQGTASYSAKGGLVLSVDARSGK